MGEYGECFAGEIGLTHPRYRECVEEVVGDISAASLHPPGVFYTQFGYVRYRQSAIAPLDSPWIRHPAPPTGTEPFSRIQHVTPEPTRTMQPLQWLSLIIEPGDLVGEERISILGDVYGEILDLPHGMSFLRSVILPCYSIVWKDQIKSVGLLVRFRHT